MPDAAQVHLEGLPVEALAAAELGVVADLPGQLGLGHGELHVPRMGVDQMTGDGDLEGLVQEPEAHRLMAGEGTAGLLLELLVAGVELAQHLLLADLLAGDGGQAAAAQAGRPEHVADAPDGEAQDQDPEQNLHHPAGGVLAHDVEHGSRTVRCG